MHQQILTADSPLALVRTGPPADWPATSSVNEYDDSQGTLLDEEVVAQRVVDLSELVQQTGKIEKPGQAFSFFSFHADQLDSDNRIKGGTTKGACVFCQKIVASTGPTRLVDHIATKCSLVPAVVQEGFRAMASSRHGKRKAKDAQMAFNEKQAAMNLEQVKAEQHKKRQQGIKAGFKMAECLIADEAIAKFFYANGIPFEVARASGGDSLYRDMVRAIQATPAGYIPPNNNKIAGPLLDSTYEHMWADINLRDADGDLAKRFGSTYVSDGWESTNHTPLINSAFITAANGGVYWRSVDTSGKIKDADYTASLMIEDIYDYGCTKVVLVVVRCNSICVTPSFHSLATHCFCHLCFSRHLPQPLLHALTDADTCARYCADVRRQTRAAL